MPDFAIIHAVIRDGAIALVPTLVVSDVPVNVDVAAAIDNAGLTPAEAGVPWANHGVDILKTRPDAPVVSWKKLCEMKDKHMRLTLRVSRADHRRLRLAADRAGLSINGWIGQLIREQAGRSQGR